VVTHTDAAFTYTNLSGLQSLKRSARKGSSEAIQQTAQQFEALFLQLMLKGMRATQFDDSGLLNSEQTRFYQGLFDQQIALDLSQRSALGLADVIARQLGGDNPLTPPRTVLTMTHSTVTQRSVTPAQGSPAAGPIVAPKGAVDQTSFMPSSPEAFVRHMWSHAQSVATQFGVAPEVLIAQAALETGWGKSVPQHSDGRSSHNLFGIKADKGWSGERVVNTTLEFIDGLPVRRRDPFRAYGSYADSFADYANFLNSNPRYQTALRVRENKSAFVHALQQAGYATDPDYAVKIERVMDSEAFKNGLQGLKFVAGEPISVFKG
jgi:flagellar protein FlgJ